VLQKVILLVQPRKPERFQARLLAPGPHTAQVSGVTGVALVEVYAVL
jgi:hypothetical protein